MMNTQEPPRVVHALPGRVRLRVQPGGDVLAWELRIKALPGVQSVVSCGVTRSLLVCFSAEALDLCRALEIEPAPRSSVGGPDDDIVAPPTPAARSVARAFWQADRALSEMSDGQIDLKLALPAALLCAGIYELATGTALAAATFHTLAWYSYNLFVQLHPQLVAGQHSENSPSLTMHS